MNGIDQQFAPGEAGAGRRQAEAIVAFWKARGFAVKAWTVSVGLGNFYVAGVRSDLINGLPPNASPADVFEAGRLLRLTAAERAL